MYSCYFCALLCLITLGDAAAMGVPRLRDAAAMGGSGKLTMNMRGDFALLMRSKEPDCCSYVHEACRAPCKGRLCLAQCVVSCGTGGDTRCKPITCGQANTKQCQANPLNRPSSLMYNSNQAKDPFGNNNGISPFDTGDEYSPFNDSVGGPDSAFPPNARPGGSVSANPPVAGSEAGGPSAGGPSAGGPSAGGPSAGGPSAGGPSTGGPSAGGPSAGGPSAGGPSTGGQFIIGGSDAALPPNARPGGSVSAKPPVTGSEDGGPDAGGLFAGGPPAGGPSAGGQFIIGGSDSALPPNARPGGSVSANPPVAGSDAGGPSDGGPSAGGPSASGPSAGGPFALGGSDAADTDRPPLGGSEAFGAEAGGPDAGGPPAGGPPAGGPPAGGSDNGGPDAGGPPGFGADSDGPDAGGPFNSEKGNSPFGSNNDQGPPGSNNGLPEDSPSASKCDKDYTQVGDKCIAWFNRPSSWLMGLTACMVADGNILTIKSQDEMDAVLKLTGGKQSWIGLKDFQDEGHFTWMNQDPVTYTNWGPGQPSGEEEQDCVSIDARGKWSDDHCKDKLPYLCQKDLPK